MALNEQQLRIKSETAAAVRDGIGEGVAARIKEKYEFLRLIAPTLPEKPTDQQFRAFAAEVSGKRSINGIPIEELNRRLQENENGRAILASNGATNLSQIFPSNEQITAIANEAGEAVATNQGSGAGNAWRFVTSGFSSEGATRRVAGNIANNLTKRLNDLTSRRPDIARFLDSEAKAKLVSRVEQGVIERVVPSKEPKRDEVAATTIKPLDEATQDAVFSGFGSMVYDKTQSTINQRIDASRSDGFKGFMMKLLEIPLLGGIIRSIAGMLGIDIPKIPSQDEIHNVSSVVAESTTGVVRDNSSRMTRTELVESVRSTTLANLRANRDASYPSFSDEQLVEMANGAAQGVNENYERIPKIAPNNDVMRQATAASEQGRDMTQGGEEANRAQRQANLGRATDATVAGR